MAETPVDSGTYADILYNIQSNWRAPETGTYRQWTGDTVTVFLAWGQVANMPNTPANGEDTGWIAMTTNQQDAAVGAFTMWAEYIGLDVQLTSQNDASADIFFSYSSTTSKDGTYAVPVVTDDRVPDTIYNTYAISKEYIWMSSTWAELSDTAIGNLWGRGFSTFLHEIGHALGLSHSGTYDASDAIPPDYGDDAIMKQDTGQYTIMSYFGDYYDVAYNNWAPPDDDIDPTFTPGPTALYWQTPTMYDIAALQSKYGSNPGTRSSDTVYGYNAAGVGGWAKLYDFATNTTPLVTIYDAGGTDTIDLSGYSGGPQIIDMRAGSYSDVLGMRNNLAIAFSTMIENVIGGGGDDTIRGNDLVNSIDGGAGIDVIDGGGTGSQFGDEILTGGSGSDTFVYSHAYCSAIITDFTAGYGGDVLDLRGQDVHSFFEVLAKASQVGADTVLDFGLFVPGIRDRLTLKNVNLDDLDPGAFKLTESEVSQPSDFSIIANPGFPGRTFYSTGAALATGFMVVETSITTYDGNHALMAHRFDARGVETGTFQVNTTAFNASGLWARAVTLANGNVAVIWMSDDTGGGGDFCFRGRIFDENGVAVTTSDFVVNSSPPVPQTSPNGWSMDVIDLFNSSSGNGFIVGWRKDVEPGDESYQTHYYERAFDNSGNPITTDIDVGAMGMPNVPGVPLNNTLREIVLSSGKVLHWWTDTVPGDASGTLKIMARFSGEGEYVVVGDNDLSQLVSVDELPDGNIVFNWTQGSRSGFSTYMGGARAVILDADLQGFVKPGTTGDDVLKGGKFNDVLYGLEGNDTLIGGRADDILDGGDGVDTADYSASIDGVTITLGSLLSQAGGHAQGDKLISIENIIGSAVDDTFRDSDAGDNSIFGNYGRDTFFAGLGNNTVDGGRGLDTIDFEKEPSDFVITYDAVKKEFTVAATETAPGYGTTKVTNLETFIFGNKFYSAEEMIAIAASHEDHPVTPVADDYSGSVGSTISRDASGGLLANDLIPDGGGKVLGINWNGSYVMSIDDPTYGTLTLSEDGSFTFLAPGQGIHTFSYLVEDANGSQATSFLNFTISSAPPVAVDDLYKVRIGASLTAPAANGLLANDHAMGGTVSVMGLIHDDQLVHTLDGDGGTLAVNGDGSFVFTADTGFSGQVSFDYSIRGNSNEADVGSVTFDVSGTNTAPAGTNTSITLKEDKTHAFVAADFGFVDSQDSLAAIIVTSLVGHGNLRFNGTAVKAGARIELADLGKLTWTAGKDLNGSSFGGLTFKVVDDGGTGGNGVDTDLTPNKLTFNVLAVTDVFTGKKGKDNLIGTDDHDILDGRQGNDRLTGSGGPDTFLFKSRYDRDTITDFDADGKNHDLIDISGLASVTSFKDLRKNHLEVHGHDLWIDGGKGDVLVIKGLSMDDVSQGLFDI